MRKAISIKSLVFTLLCSALSVQLYASAWTQKAAFNGGTRLGAVGFSIGDKGYLGTGEDNCCVNHYINDFWEYTWGPGTLGGVWTQKASLPGPLRRNATGFSIGNKGFIGTGYNDSAWLSDFWEWNQSTNTWTQKTDFAGVARAFAVGFSIGSHGYVGTGYNNNNGTHYSDFWQYDTTGAGTWTKKTDFPGVPRRQAAGLVLNGRGYVGMGYNGSYHNDFYEYDTTGVGTWTRKADYTGGLINEAKGFSLCNKGYICTGELSPGGYNFTTQFYEYTWAPGALGGTWLSMPSFTYLRRFFATVFTIGTKAYVATGLLNSSSVASDVWEYDPLALTVTVSNGGSICNGQPVTVFATNADSAGATNYLWNTGNTAQSFTVSPTSTITYSLSVDHGTCHKDTTAKITVNNPPSIVINGKRSSCPDSVTSLTASGGTSYLWSTGATTNTLSVSPSSLTTYTLVVGNNGCSKDTTVSISINAVPSVSITGNAPICYGSSINLTATGANTYVWSNGATTSAITVNPTTTATYSVTGNNGSCTNKANTSITVNPKPAITTCCGATIVQGNSTAITVSPAAGNTIKWTPGLGLSCDNCPNPIASPPATTTYYATMTDANNCSSTDSVIINVNLDCSDIFVPTAFSPNGDNVNDVFMVKTHSRECVQSISFEVFDRWGQMVFESFDVSSAWDGKFKGKELSTAVFIYNLQAVLVDGTSIHKKGNLSLIR